MPLHASGDLRFGSGLEAYPAAAFVAPAWRQHRPRFSQPPMTTLVPAPSPRPQAATSVLLQTDNSFEKRSASILPRPWRNQAHIHRLELKFRLVGIRGEIGFSRLQPVLVIA